MRRLASLAGQSIGKASQSASKTAEDSVLSHIIYETGKDHSSKSPILLHHGLFGRKENWSTTGKGLNHLTKRSIIIPDARNHGNSINTRNMTIKIMSDDLVKLLQTLKVTKTSIVGHDMGGIVAMFTAITRPDLVDKLIVSASTPIKTEKYTDREELVRQACYVLKTLEKNSESDLNSVNFKMEADDALKSIISDAKERALFVSNLTGVNHEAILANPGLWKFPSMVGNKSIKNPVLFVSGEKEPLWENEDDVAAARAVFPNSIFKQIPGAGHYPHSENSEKFLEVITTFLQLDN